MYVAVKGGERAIERSWDVLAKKRRGDLAVPELSVEQIREQLRLSVARVMTERLSLRRRTRRDRNQAGC